MDYRPWLLKKNGLSHTVVVLSGQLQNQSVIAHLKGIDDRDAASALIGAEIYIDYQQLPPVQQGEYYWSDLIGLQVVNTQGVELGVIESLMETGANDVIILQGEPPRAIPFLQNQTILAIDLNARKMLVDWDDDF